MIEKLSGSEEFKQKYDQLRNEIAALEADIKKCSEKLKEMRHEKIKIKGLSDF